MRAAVLLSIDCEAYPHVTSQRLRHDGPLHRAFLRLWRLALDAGGHRAWTGSQSVAHQEDPSFSQFFHHGTCVHVSGHSACRLSLFIYLPSHHCFRTLPLAPLQYTLPPQIVQSFWLFFGFFGTSHGAQVAIFIGTIVFRYLNVCPDDSSSSVFECSWSIRSSHPVFRWLWH